MKSFTQSQLAASSDQAPVKLRRGSKLTQYQAQHVDLNRILSPDEQGQTVKLPAIQNEKSFQRDPHASPAYSLPSASKFHSSKASRMMTYERGASREYLMSEEERKERFYYEGRVYEKPP